MYMTRHNKNFLLESCELQLIIIRTVLQHFTEPVNHDVANTKLASTAALVLLMTLTASALHSSIPHPAYASAQPVIKSGGLLSAELLSSGWAGFFAGCLHTLSGPDHLVALAPLSIGRSRLESGLVGALWGCGHDAGQIIFGLLFLLLKDRLHIEVLRIWGTRVVGLTLLMIGATGIREASEVQESGLILEGVDMNGSEPLQQAPAVAPRKKKVGFTTFATGVIHGLQPDALLMVLPALALPSRFAGAAYLGSCSEALKDRIPKITEKLTWAASLVALSSDYDTVGILRLQLILCYYMFLGKWVSLYFCKFERVLWDFDPDPTRMVADS
ncbi:unnamed protein product [Triticum turgidum subsp. durum]|uniref:Urease accessory protein UreH-like transmembrane domain-containing protein n=1 Tax=Triticum turgidum subsp. durum TaxID=4567 RepID=A0A9R0VTZ5_TRITD|nr:unnamed protein product [Triticum turgidum subsp. durum]